MNLPYIGVGAGAHSYFSETRFVNEPIIGNYIQKVQLLEKDNLLNLSPANISRQSVDSYTQMQDTMLLGLRMVKEGISESRFYNRHGVHIMDIFKKEINMLCGKGLVEWVDQNGEKALRLTKRGVMFGNIAFREFVY